MRTKIVALFALLITMLTGCQWNRPPYGDKAERIMQPFPYLARRELAWEDYIKPDLVVVSMRVCRTQEMEYVRWDVLAVVQNQGGNLGLDVEEAPVDVYVDFDPSRPYGYDPATGVPRTLADYPEYLRDRPVQKWMNVPRAGGFGGVSFSLWYPDGGPGYPYRRVPTQFFLILDQFRGGAPGLVDENNEGNNGVIVLIDRYDEINGRTGGFAIGCWYN